MKTNNSIIKSIARLVSVVLLMAVGVGQMWGAAATLPVDYTFSGGKSSLPTGVTANGLGDNYSDGTYKLKLDGDGDYIQLETDGAVGQLIFTVKMLGGTYTSSFQVKGSSDGTNYYNIGGIHYISGLNTSTVVNCTTSVAINPTYRYFQFIFKKGSNVGFGKLKASKATTSKYTVTFNAHGGSYADESGFTTTSPNYTITEANAAEGIILPEPTPPAGCASDGWGFYGWATSEVASETTTAPTIVGKAGDRYYPTSATPLHAVYATGEYTKITSIGSGGLTSGGKYLIVAHSGGYDYIMKSSELDFQNFSNTIEMVAAQVDETDGKFHAADVNAQWCYTIESSDDSWWIRDIVNSSTYNYADLSYTNWWGMSEETGDDYTIGVSAGIWSIKNNYYFSSSDYYLYFGFDATNSAFCSYTGAQNILLYKQTTTPNYYSSPSCCDYEVSISESGSSHLAAVDGMTFSSSSIATCGDEASRTITITVTPASGYTLFGDTKPVFTKTSGTVADPTITGPTDNGDGTYSYECTFNSNDNGAGTFAISPGQFTNYRTTCSTTYDITLDKNGGDANGSAKVAANGTTLTSIEAPTKNGYDIEGYYTTSGLTTKIATDAGALSASVTVSSDDWTDENSKWILGDGATFYTKWTAHEYTITYEGLEGASNTNPTSYTVVTPTITLVNPGSRTGYTFSGWTLGGSPITQIVLGSTGDKTITATWSINTPNLAVSAADHVVITATPASESAIAEGANRNVNYNKTVTLNCTPDEHWNLVWDVYKTGESSTKVALSGSGDGATFTMPDYGVTVSAVMTEAAYKTVCFKNNGEDIDGYASVKVYVGESPVAPTLTDGTSGDACDETSDTHYGWTQTTMPDVVPSKATIDAYTGAQTVYAKAATLPAITAGDDGTTITYHAVWAEGVGVPSNEWQLVTSTSSLETGDKVVIGHNNTGTIWLLGYQYITPDATDAKRYYNRKYASNTETVSDSKITLTSDEIATAIGNTSKPYVLTIGKSGDYWTFYDDVYEGYLYAAGTNDALDVEFYDKNLLNCQAVLTNAGKWELTINGSTGAATIVSQTTSGTTRKNLQRNGTDAGGVFSCYPSQTDPYIYKNLSTTGYQNFLTTCCANIVEAPEVTGTPTKNSITLSWTNVTGATGYTVTSSGGTPGDVSSDGTARSCVITGLSPNTNYTWSVVATYTTPYCLANTANGNTTTSQVYAVSYNGNGKTSGSVPTDANLYSAGEEVTVKTNSGTLVKSGHTFTGWNTANDGSGEHYDADGSTSFTMPSEAVVLYAEWTAKKNYFVDRMHGNWDGEHTEPTTGYNCYLREGAGYTVPDLSDDATGSNSCVTGHAHFVGWVASGNIGAQGQLMSGYTIIKGGTSGTASVDGTIYYAVWAEE